MRLPAKETTELLARIAFSVGKGILKDVDDFATKGPVGRGLGTGIRPFPLLYPFPKRRSPHSYRNLIRGGYIKERNNGIEITNKGKLVLIAHKAKLKESENKWDGKWRVVMFDVPEELRRDRSFVRTHLKMLGFRECQKSVWISPYDTKNEVKAFFRLCNRKPVGNFKIMLVDEIDDDRDLRKQFDI